MSYLYRFKQFVRRAPLFKKIIQIRNKRRLEIQNEAVGELVQKYGLDVARSFIQSLETVDCKVFCTFGMLLGLVREGHFLKNDADLDFGYLVVDESDWIRIERSLTSVGFEKMREFSYQGVITEQTYKSKGIFIDLFGYFRRGDSIVSYAYRRDLDTVYPDRDSYTAYFHTAPKFERIIDLPCDYGTLPAPEHPEVYLESVYGPGWRTPSSWENGSGPNITFLSEFGLLKVFSN